MKKIERYRYEIDNDYAVRIWDDECLNEENKPIRYQPHNPEGGFLFSSEEEASDWAEKEITHLLSRQQS